MIVSKLADADGEATEAQVWLDFARDCKYMPAACVLIWSGNMRKWEECSAP
jgi:hypothetical protein